MLTPLCELARRFDTDKGPGQHEYTPIYTRHLDDIREGVREVLEIGVFRGASLRMWEAWFPTATITGIDIDKESALNEGRIRTVIQDVKEYQPDRSFDLIVDDGSHDTRDITAAAERLLPALNPGGWYVIEDLAVVSPDSTAFALIESVIEDLATDRECLISEVHIYPQLVFLRRHPLKGET